MRRRSASGVNVGPSATRVVIDQQSGRRGWLLPTTSVPAPSRPAFGWPASTGAPRTRGRIRSGPGAVAPPASARSGYGARQATPAGEVAFHPLVLAALERSPVAENTPAADIGGADIGGHDQDRVFEIYRPALSLVQLACQRGLSILTWLQRPHTKRGSAVITPMPPVIPEDQTATRSQAARKAASLWRSAWWE
jgi:hypothetical protein